MSADLRLARIESARYSAVLTVVQQSTLGRPLLLDLCRRFQEARREAAEDGLLIGLDECVIVFDDVPLIVIDDVSPLMRMEARYLEREARRKP